MAGIGDVGILFKIKADSDQAEREFKKFKKELNDIDERGKDPLQRLASQAGLTAAQFSGLQTAVLGATAIIGTVSVAAIAAVTAIARLTVATSEFGSALFDAQAKTGLTAGQLSALKVAADTSGSSLDSIANSVAKFNVLFGQAANDEKSKAAEVLAKYGITATNSSEALEQAFNAVYNATNKNVAAAELFKDKTGQTIAVIDTAGGSLLQYEAICRKLGLTLTEQDLKAADDFGDTLDILGKQAKAAGQQFALELMPNVTHAMQTISGEMENNQSVARSWGRAVGDIVRGLEVAILDLRLAFQSQFAGINAILGTNVTAMIDWANVVLGIVSPALAILRQVGQANPLGAGQMGGTFNPSAGVPRISGGRGGGGGGGARGGAGKAERDTSVQEAQDRDRKILENFKASSEQMVAENDRKLAAMEIDEQEHIAELYRIKLAELDFERNLLEQQLNLAKLTAKEREDIEHRIGIIRTARRTEEIREKREITEQDLKDLKELDEILERMHKAVMARLEKEHKRKNDLAKKIANDKQREREEELQRQRTLRASVQGIGTGGTDEFGRLIEMAGGNSAMVAGIETVRLAFEGLAQAIGQVVQAWVLYGSAGASVRQVTAQILASIAQQAAVKAIFELAEGFAALARAFFGDPKAGAEATMHFKSAATYGIVAGVAAVAGRGVAGSSFNQTAGSAGSGGIGAGNGASQQNNFTTRFNGFGNAMGEQIRQQNQVIAALEETINRFDRKFNTASPGAVVMAGANEASRAIVGALHNEYSDNPASVDGTMRNLGFAR